MNEAECQLVEPNRDAMLPQLVSGDTLDLQQTE